MLDPEVAAGFLVNRTGDPDEQAAAELAGELGGLPLALEQAAAYIQATGDHPGRVPGAVPGPAGGPAGPRRAAGYPADGGDHLGAGACPGWRRGARPRRGCCGCWPAWRPSRSRWPCCSPTRRSLASWPRSVAAAVGPLLGDPLAAGDAVAALRRYSLVTPAGDGLVLVHRLVQAVTLDQMPADAGRPVAAGRRGPGRGRDPRRPRAARGLAGVRGAAAARPGCP